ncbi:hypothetical protein BDQ17DRAFT_1360245, partial [Cyathus striatus]
MHHLHSQRTPSNHIWRPSASTAIRHARRQGVGCGLAEGFTCSIGDNALAVRGKEVKGCEVVKNNAPRSLDITASAGGCLRSFLTDGVQGGRGTVQEWNGGLSARMVLGIVYHSGSASLKVLPIGMNGLSLIVGYATF